MFYWVLSDDSRTATEDGTDRRWALYYVDLWGRMQSSGLTAGYEVKEGTTDDKLVRGL